MDSISGGPFSGPTSPPQADPPVLSCARTLVAELESVSGASATWLSTDEKREALLALERADAMLASLKMRVMADSSDVADEDGCRNVTQWITPRTRSDRVRHGRAERLAGDLDERWLQVAEAMAEGRMNLDQTQVVVRALNALDADLPAELLAKAEAHLVAMAAEFGPHELRRLGDKVLEVVCPETYEDEERKKLEAAQQRASAATRLTINPRGDGSADVRGRIPEAMASRLKTYLDSFTSPRHDAMQRSGCAGGADPVVGSIDPATGRKLPYDRVLGEAFCAFLEAADPARMPLHGGNATKVIVTVSLADLRAGTGVATLGDGTRITIGESRRLLCNAGVLPAVLGGKSEVLDLGRESRFYKGPARQALAVEHPVCRGEGCSIPATWCEAHHKKPWSEGGRTDLKDGILLCPWHHHRIHDPAYSHEFLANGDVRYNRRR